MMTNNQHQIAISTGLAELAHTEYQVKKRPKMCWVKIYKQCFRLVIMKMQKNIRCNFGDKTQPTRGSSFFWAPYTFSAGDMTSESWTSSSYLKLNCSSFPGQLISPLWPSNRTRCWPRPTPILATCSKSGASFRRRWTTTDTPSGSSQTSSMAT